MGQFRQYEVDIVNLSGNSLFDRDIIFSQYRLMFESHVVFNWGCHYDTLVKVLCIIHLLFFHLFIFVTIISSTRVIITELLCFVVSVTQ